MDIACDVVRTGVNGSGSTISFLLRARRETVDYGLLPKQNDPEIDTAGDEQGPWCWEDITNSAISRKQMLLPVFSSHRTILLCTISLQSLSGL